VFVRGGWTGRGCVAAPTVDRAVLVTECVEAVVDLDDSGLV